MGPVFVYGTLCDARLRAVVLGRAVTLRAAVMPGHAVHLAAGQNFPLIIASDGTAAGGLLEGLSADDLARLEFYEQVFGYDLRAVTVQADGPVAALAWFPPGGGFAPGPPWSLADWQVRWGDIAAATAADVMALHGAVAPADVARRFGHMLVRGSSRARAAMAAPAMLRRSAAEGDVAVMRRTQPYANFFAVEEYDLTFRRFDGTPSAVVNRAVFVSGDAVTVVPYDPVRDCVLLIEQFRAGPFGRGDPQPWHLEPIAGRIDPGETPQEAARREAVEEAGITLGALERVADYYPSPGAKSEFLYSFVALADLPDGSAGTFGLEGEGEDIRGHLVPLDRLLAMVNSGEVATAPLILTAFWLDRWRRNKGKA